MPAGISGYHLFYSFQQLKLGLGTPKTAHGKGRGVQPARFSASGYVQGVCSRMTGESETATDKKQKDTVKSSFHAVNILNHKAGR